MKALLLCIRVMLVLALLFWGHEMAIFFKNITHHQFNDIVVMLAFQFFCVCLVLILLYEAVKPYNPPSTRKVPKC